MLLNYSSLVESHKEIPLLELSAFFVETDVYEIERNGNDSSIIILPTIKLQ